MDAVEATYSAWKARIDADTSSGGLSYTTAPFQNQYVAGGTFRMGDPQRTRQDNRLEIQLTPLEADTELGSRNVEVLVRVKIVTKRDLGFTRQNAIEERLIARFKDIATLTATGWTLSAPVLLRPSFQVNPDDDTEMAAVVEFMQHLIAA